MHRKFIFKMQKSRWQAARRIFQVIDFTRENFCLWIRHFVVEPAVIGLLACQEVVIHTLIHS